MEFNRIDDMKTILPMKDISNYMSTTKMSFKTPISSDLKRMMRGGDLMEKAAKRFATKDIQELECYEQIRKRNYSARTPTFGWDDGQRLGGGGNSDSSRRNQKKTRIPQV